MYNRLPLFLLTAGVRDSPAGSSKSRCIAAEKVVFMPTDHLPIIVSEDVVRVMLLPSPVQHEGK